jgi:hypothetical protein
MGQKFRIAEKMMQRMQTMSQTCRAYSITAWL